MYKIQFRENDSILGTKFYPIIPRLGDRCFHPKTKSISLNIRKVILIDCTDESGIAAIVCVKSKELTPKDLTNT